MPASAGRRPRAARDIAAAPEAGPADIPRLCRDALRGLGAA